MLLDLELSDGPVLNSTLPHKILLGKDESRKRPNTKVGNYISKQLREEHVRQQCVCVIPLQSSRKFSSAWLADQSVLRVWSYEKKAGSMLCSPMHYAA